MTSQAFEWLGVHLLVQAAVLIRILVREDRDPAVRMAWTLVVFALPFVGAGLYILFGEARIAGPARYRMRLAVATLPREPGGAASGEAGSPAPAEPKPGHGPAFARASAVNALRPTGGNRLELSDNSAHAMSRMIADIDAAKDHVHLCFYIWLDDDTGRNVADAVVRAAARGVTVRCLADGLGSRLFIRSPHWTRMRAAGALLAVAFPFRFSLLQVLRSRIDIRNHRKVAIIDGRIAYVGSQNCCDAAFHVKAAFAPWVDVMARLTGPAVWQAQYLFLCDWLSHSGEHRAAALLDLPAPPPEGSAIAVAMGSGPDLQKNAVTDVFEAVIAAARSEIEITTPYYVPDMALHRSVLSAAMRGVWVRLILPARVDSRLVAFASRSFYRSLIVAGVEVYEYGDGLMHAKTLVADRELVVIGSANMDRRSFELNYESGMLIEDSELGRALARRREDWLAASRRVTLEEVKAWSTVRRIANNVLVLFAPLL